MDNFTEIGRQIRASEQRSEIRYRLTEMIASSATTSRQAAALLRRLRSSDIRTCERDFVREDLQAVRDAVSDVLASISEIEAACVTEAPAVYLEAAE